MQQGNSFMSLNNWNDRAFWDAIDSLVSWSKIVIDRPGGSHHPRFPSLVYPLNYGYLENTPSMDGHGIDVWQGSHKPSTVTAIMCTIDLLKKDSEIKLLIGCTPDEIEIIYHFYNQNDYMKGILIRRPSGT
jgi:inorganic pyrophosphatase